MINLSSAMVRVGLTRDHPVGPARPDRSTLLFRQAMGGRRFGRVQLINERVLQFALKAPSDTRTMQIQLAGRYPNLVVFDSEGSPLAQAYSDRPTIDPDSSPLKASDDHVPPIVDAHEWLDTLDDIWRHEAKLLSLQQQRQSLLRAARQLHRRQQRKLKAIGHDLERTRAAERWRREGELLKVNLFRLSRGMKVIELTDWNGDTLSISLDPRLDGVANMQRCFKRYRKYLGAQDKVEERMSVVQGVTSACADIIQELAALSLDETDQYHDLSAKLNHAHTALTQLGWRPPPDKQVTRRTQHSAPAVYHCFRSQDGTRILVGRHARHNDTLTFQVARGHDIWLHARDVGGSHVILVTGRKDPNQEALLDAATLAAWHSKARGEAQVDVMWTERKHVRKARDAGPGRVTVASPRTVRVRMDEVRIERLYATRSE